MYSNFDYYAHTYHGALSQTEYHQHAHRAAAHIDRITSGRAAVVPRASPHYAAILQAECAVVDELALQARGGVVTSETNDGISRSYASGSAVKSNTRRIYDAAAVYLFNTGLLFAGV